MSKKENFKDFVIKNPEFAKSVSVGKTTWQKLYELYDLYGEQTSLWDEYRTSSETNDSSFGIKDIINSIKGINLESLQNNVTSLQKAVGFLEDLTRDSGKKKETKKKNKSDILDPLDRFYND